jgi:hypothetical protein
MQLWTTGLSYEWIQQIATIFALAGAEREREVVEG